LWLAVIITPPTALRCLTAKDTDGVGVGGSIIDASGTVLAEVSGIASPDDPTGNTAAKPPTGCSPRRPKTSGR
jgi:hypothetical protein